MKTLFRSVSFRHFNEGFLRIDKGDQEDKLIEKTSKERDELKERIEQTERDLADSRSENEKLQTSLGEASLGEANRELTDSRAVNKKTKGEVERFRKRYDEREEEWGEKLHTEMKRRGEELLRVLDAKLEDLIKGRDKSHEYAAT